MIRIRFEPSGEHVDVSAPVALIDVLDELPGTHVSLSCRAAHCATCRVCVEHGHNSLEPAEKAEQRTLHELSSASDQRLACQLRVRAGATEPVVLRVLQKT